MTEMINDFTATSLGSYEWLLFQFFHELLACKLYHYVDYDCLLTSVAGEYMASEKYNTFDWL